MARTLDPLKCGECGGSTFSLFHERTEGEVRFGGGGGGHVDGRVIVQCLQCKDKTTLGVQATLTSDGNLCGGWSKS